MDKPIQIHRKNTAVDSIIGGALYDFLGWATSQEQPITLGRHVDAVAGVDALSKWARLRGLDISNCAVGDWRYKRLYFAPRVAEAPQQPPTTTPQVEGTPEANKGPQMHAGRGWHSLYPNVGWHLVTGFAVIGAFILAVLLFLVVMTGARF